MSISRLLVFQWVLIVPHWLQIFSYIHMKLLLYNIYEKSKFKKQKSSFNLIFRYMDYLSLNNNIYIIHC